jgi:aspartyl-tRNA(Asn)/glutamyl-tRNA(Gln) amidotransferase subunit B
MPGVLPVLNRKVVEYTLRMALATGCRINSVSRFARKNYFYPDLPKGYQISQYELPIAEHGHLDIETDSGCHRIGITRIHMEEDAGKLVHDDPGRFQPGGPQPHRCAADGDRQRTGSAHAGRQAGAYLRKLRSIVRYLG